jgi:hypothetical protein
MGNDAMRANAATESHWFAEETLARLLSAATIAPLRRRVVDTDFASKLPAVA